MNEIGYNAMAAMAAMAGIVIICCLALYLGYDGAILLTCVGVISGLGGYPILANIYNGPIKNMALEFQKQQYKKGPPGH